MAEYTDDLKSLHIALIDRRQGQEEALQAAEGRELSPLFRDVIALRAKHRELDVLLRRQGPGSTRRATLAGNGFSATLPRDFFSASWDFSCRRQLSNVSAGLFHSDFCDYRTFP